MATHNIVFEKIEFSRGAAEEPAFWTNYLPGCTEIGATVDGYTDVSELYTPNGTGIWVPGTGWTSTSSFPSDPNELAIYLNNQGSTEATTKIRLTITVTGALDLLVDYIGKITVSSSDNYDGLLCTPVGGGDTEYDLHWSLSTTGTGADIQTYIFEWDTEVNPSAGFGTHLGIFRYYYVSP